MCSSRTHPPPPPPPQSLPLRATEIPRGGGWVKKEAISERGGVAYRGFFFPGGLLPVFKTSITACIYHLLPTVGQILFFFTAYAMVFFYTIVIGSWINVWLSSSHIIAKNYVSHKNIVQQLFSRGCPTKLKNYGNSRGGVGGGMTNTLRNGNAKGWGSKEKCHP